MKSKVVNASTLQAAQKREAPAKRKGRITDAHFKVTHTNKIDGKSTGTLTVEAPKASGIVLVSYRPSHGRNYTLTIQEVAEMICWRVSKKENK
jgi:hypothetical protein